MIVDWARHCEYIHSHKTLDLSKQSKKTKLKQEIIYLAYLTNVLNLDAAECFSHWKAIDNGIAALFAGDSEQQTIEFYRLMVKSKKPKYVNVNYKQHLEPVTIYKEEIEYLNRLDVPLWVRQYWLGLLFYYKFERQNSKRVQLTKTLNTWCIEHCTDIKGKPHYYNRQDTIAKHRLLTRKNVIQYYDKHKEDQYSSYCPAFIKYGGEIAGVYDDVNQIDEVIKLISPRYRICSKCGKKFIVNSKTKTDLCPACYAEKRKEKERERIRKLRNSRKAPKK